MTPMSASTAREGSADSPAAPPVKDGKSADGQSKNSADRLSRGPGAPTEKPLAPKRRRLPRIVVAALIVTAVGGGILFYATSQVPQAETQLVLMGNIDVRQVNLAFKVDGRIETLAVDEGDAVTAGQVLATLDKRYFNDDLRVARARRNNLAANVAKLEHGSRPEEMAQARAQTADRDSALERAREDYDRAKNLVGKGAVSRQEFDQYRSALNSAEAQAPASRESQRLTAIGPRQEDIDIARAQLAEQEATIVQIERRLADAEL